ncbi:MAG: RNA polymerase sigma factor [Pyrinomonadaceae bacterium]|nr:RNA polymerase sigma factor [Pyrinomonadaceae bacterium]
MDSMVDIGMSNETNNSITKTVNQFGKKLFGFIRGKVNTQEDAEDILQDVWSQYSGLDDAEELENVSGWLYQVARNKIIDLYRKKKPDYLEDYSYETEDGEFDFKEILLIDESESPELQMLKDLFWEELIKALNELPENQRQVFVLNEFEDLTLQEIADKYNENLKTIISRKGYAVKHLRKKLKYLYDELAG